MPENPASGGKPVDASGEFMADGVNKHFKDGVDLVGFLSGSREVHDCLARQWLRYALRRREIPADERSLARVQESFFRTSDIRELFRLGAQPELFEKVREFGVPYDRTFDEEEGEFVCTPHPERDPGFGGKNLSAEAEGLTIYYGPGDAGYLIASSQGVSTFSVFRRTGDNRLVGRLLVGDGPAIDGTQHCDGAAVVNVPLGPRFPKGLLVLHDGENRPDVLDAEGEVRGNTNFKLVAWPDLATALDLIVTPWRAARSAATGGGR